MRAALRQQGRRQRTVLIHRKLVQLARRAQSR